MDFGEVAEKTVDVVLLLLIVVIAAAVLTQPGVIEFLTQEHVQEPEAPPQELPVQEPPPGAAVPPDLDLNHTAPYGMMEKSLYKRVNEKREEEGLEELRWNDDVASVAREHSVDLALENTLLTERDRLCYVPMLHHEGTQFGLYHDDRLEKRGIYYFEKAGENMYLASVWKARTTYDLSDANCSEESFILTHPLDIEDIEAEFQRRLAYIQALPKVNWSFTAATQDEVEETIIEGWMTSPGHRANLLNEEYNETGIGIAKVNDFYFITQVFIKRVQCGYRGGLCCKEEGFYPYCYVPLECIDAVCVKTTY